MRKPPGSSVFWAVIVFLCAGISYAYAIDDGFIPARKINTRYFDVWLAANVDIPTLNQDLGVTAADKILAGITLSPEAPADQSKELQDMLDTVYLRACKTLDMHLYSYRGLIKVCRDSAELNRIYRTLFNKGLDGMSSFYVFELNTIYISKEDFRSKIVGHEMAHALINHYFVVAPSVRVQEILAGYVTYQLGRDN